MRFSFVADHFQYLASIGVLAFFPALLRSGILSATAMVILGSLTWMQGHAYKDLETLWRSVLDRNPRAWIAHNNLAILLAENGRPEEAKPHYLAAIRLKPDYDHALNNLGILLLDEERLEEALPLFENMLRFDNPYHAAALGHIGLIKLRQGLFPEAEKYLAEALAINPGYVPAHINLGLVFFNMGRPEDAIRHYRLALRYQPDSADAHHNIALALLNLRQIEEARHHLAASLALQPRRAETRKLLDSLSASTENPGRPGE
jgi:tetratricopeptide (TPR) repeat protein